MLFSPLDEYNQFRQELFVAEEKDREFSGNPNQRDCRGDEVGLTSSSAAADC